MSSRSGCDRPPCRQENFAGSVTGRPLRHIVWDWNGTLTDDVDHFVASLNRMLRRRRLPSVNREHYRETFDFPVRSFYHRLGFDLEEEDWDALTNEFHRGFPVSSALGLRPQARETLGRLRQAGFGMSILSALEQGLLDQAVSGLGLRPFFDHVCGAGDLNGDSKLASGQRLAASLALPACSVCLVGDTTHDHAVAVSLGWRSLLLTAGHHSPRRLGQVGRMLADDLAQVGDLLIAGLRYDIA